MKIALDFGHGVGADRGAVGHITEESVIDEVGNALVNLLRQQGHEIIKTRPKYASSLRESLSSRCRLANVNNVDLFISIHANACEGKGFGSEIWTYKGSQHSKAVAILNNLSKLGFRNRGIKDGRNLAVVNGTKATAMLIELFFIDSNGDVSLYKKQGKDNIAKAIASVFENNTSLKGLLRYGSTGEQVKTLQSLLNKKGYNLDIDGIYGQCTLNAVRDFQSKAHIDVDGIVGQITWSKLNK